MKRKYVYLYLLGLLLFSVACTGNFRDYNTDLSGITDDDLIIDDNGYGIRLGIIQQGIYFNYDYGKGKNWPFQLIQNLNADMFSGYMHDGKPLNGGSHNSDYNMQDGWNSAMWTHMYSYIFPQIYQSENATRNTHPALFGITKILKVEAMHRVTDYYGPIIYKNFANAEKHYRPDKQEDVYYGRNDCSACFRFKEAIIVFFYFLYFSTSLIGSNRGNTHCQPQTQRIGKLHPGSVFPIQQNIKTCKSIGFRFLIYIVGKRKRLWLL